MKLFILVLLISLFSCATRQEETDTKSKWQYYYDLGMSSYIAKNYSEATANFFRASQLAPKEPKVWNALGLAYMEVQEYQKAENAFLKALQVDKTYTEAKLNLGVLYYRQKEYEKALKSLGEVVKDEAFPQKHMAFYFLAKVYQAIDRREDYLSNLRKAVAYNPMFFDAQIELAQFYESEENYPLAKDVYQRLITNGLGNPFIYLSMARVEYRLGNYASAKEYIRRVIEDKQTPPQVKSQAYEVLSAVLIEEQRKKNIPKPEPEPPKPPSVELPQPQPQPQPQQVERFYRIQIGAFSSASSANAWKNRVERELGLRDVIVVEGEGVFRVFYGRFESREEALRELKRLRNLNIYGFVVYK